MVGWEIEAIHDHVQERENAGHRKRLGSSTPGKEKHRVTDALSRDDFTELLSMIPRERLYDSP